MTFSLIRFISQRISPLRGASANFSSRERKGASSGKTSVPRNIAVKTFSASLNSRNVKQTESRKIGIFARFQHYLHSFTPAYKVRMKEAQGKLNGLKLSLNHTNDILDHAKISTGEKRKTTLMNAIKEFNGNLDSLADIPPHMRADILDKFKQIESTLKEEAGDVAFGAERWHTQVRLQVLTPQ